MSVKNVFLFFLFIVVLFGCKTKQGDETFNLTFPNPIVNRDIDSIRHRGYITVLVDNNSVSYFIYRGLPMGYEYDLLKLVAKKLNVKLKVKVISGIGESIDMLNRGDGDIIAFPITITKERSKYILFSNPFFTTRQVLVQRKPENWEYMSPELIDKKLIRNPVNLVGKDVYVIKSSSFKTQLKNLSKEIKGEIIIHEDAAIAESESLLRKVAEGEIDYTVTDEMTAQVNQLYYPNIDIATVISSSPQQIGWAVRKNSPQLGKFINAWLAKAKMNGSLKIIYEKYFKNPRIATQSSSEYHSRNKKKLSPYDDYLKEGAKKIGWDWRLLAALMYQESQFNPRARSWVGAVGLMQVLPETAQQFGIKNLLNPELNINAGVRFLKYLDDYWQRTVTDSLERQKFVLASYNIGLTHVIDAQKLTQKYGKKKEIWDDNVAFYLMKKSEPKYYRDAVVMAGYCRGYDAVWFVQRIFHRYEEYKIHIEV